MKFVYPFVPLGHAYYKIRAVLKMGVLRYFKILLTGTNEKRKFPQTLSVIAMAKNEGAYFREWLEYHRLIGVEKFYIYDNESDDGTKQILAPYIKKGIVEYIPWHGTKQQIAIYTDAILRTENKTKWLAVIDLDEFMVPLGTDTLKPFIKSIPSHANQVYLLWENFGSNGHKKKPAGLVIESYTKTGYVAERGKVLVNPRAVCGVSNPHWFYLARGATVDENFRPFTAFDWGGKITVKPSRHFPKSKIRINHYWLKSFEEFASKRTRGRANGKPGDVSKYSAAAFDRKDINLNPDDSMKRFIKKVKEQTDGA